MSLVISIILGYLLGALPFSFWLGKLKGVDLRKVGSGNIGATNLARALGPGWGILAFLLDMSKGLAAVLLAGYLGNVWSCGLLSLPLLKIVAGISSIAGHNWTFLLHFKGGKGVATSAGVFLGLAPLSLGMAVLVWILIFAASRYVSLASLIASISLPLWMVWQNKPLELVIFSGIACILIIYRHRTNIKRLLKGEENRWGRKKQKGNMTQEIKR